MSVIDEGSVHVPPELTRPLRVFLCHSSKDKAVVRRLYAWLRTEGVDPWLDEESLLAGADWKQEIYRAIRASDVVIVCLSRYSTEKSGFVHKEIADALDVADEQPEGMIYIVPVRLNDCEIPGRLKRWHTINLYDVRGHDRLLGSLWNRARSLQNRLLFTTWPDAPVALDEFSHALLRELRCVTEEVTNVLLSLGTYPPRVSQDDEVRSRANAAIATLSFAHNLDIDITCLDEETRYFIHQSYPQGVGALHDRLWAVSQGPAFSEWFWTRVREMQRGLLTWTDIIADSVSLPARLSMHDYARKTVVSFRTLAVAPSITWTVAVEGHELARRRVV